MEPPPDKQAQLGIALQEHADFKRQCEQFRAQSAQLRHAIHEYQEQLARLHREQSTHQHLTPDELRVWEDAVQQQLWDTEINLHALRFEFYDLAAKYKELRTIPSP